MNAVYISQMVSIARMGVKVAPMKMQHQEHGDGTLFMDKDGVRFDNTAGETKIKLTWDEFFGETPPRYNR